MAEHELRDHTSALSAHLADLRTTPAAARARLVQSSIRSQLSARTVQTVDPGAYMRFGTELPGTGDSIGPATTFGHVAGLHFV